MPGQMANVEATAFLHSRPEALMHLQSTHEHADAWLANDTIAAALHLHSKVAVIAVDDICGDPAVPSPAHAQVQW